MKCDPSEDLVGVKMKEETKDCISTSVCRVTHSLYKYKSSLTFVIYVGIIAT